MGKPRYPAHVVHLLPRYPAKWCEECGDPILPRLEKPNARYPRVHLEQVTKFKGKRYCSRGCARRARARAERNAKEPPAPPPEPAVVPEPVQEPPRVDGIPTPNFPTPAGLNACQLTTGTAYAQPKGPQRPMPIRRRKPKPSKLRPLPDQVADFVTGTKGRRITPREIAKAYDLTEPEADSLLGELADEHRIRRRTDALGRPEYESIRP